MESRMVGVSILNDVLGPVMRGPSSSHTAGPLLLSTLARALLGGEPASAAFTFDPGGSFAQVYRQERSDLGFAAGLMGWSISDERFPQALDFAAAQGLRIAFAVESLPNANHPNTVDIRLVSQQGQALHLAAGSVGGGAVVINELDGWPVHLTGDAYEVLVACEQGAEAVVHSLLGKDHQLAQPILLQVRSSQVLLHARRHAPLPEEALDTLKALPDVLGVWTAPPVFFVQHGQPLFTSAVEMVSLAEQRGESLGRVALAYESALLGLPEHDVLEQVLCRFEVMRAAVHRGLDEHLPSMQLLQPSARAVYQAEAQGRVAIGGLHTRAAARAMAVMHVNAGSGIVCAAPTGGSAGTLPGVLVTLAEEKGLDPQHIALALLAGSAVGLVVASRATFAAEVAGCQVEIGAAGAMAAAAVVEAAGGSARQACGAAAISFQNTMGSVCDLVQGVVEIPCHTRNAVAASSAFVCADLILGGYVNSIPLDETIDAVYAVGKMLPRELKVTSLGGLAVAPSALALPRLRDKRKPGTTR
jgi:L-serine dehydratase